MTLLNRNIYRCRDRFLTYTRDSEVRQQLGLREKRRIDLEHDKEENMVKKSILLLKMCSDTKIHVLFVQDRT